MQAPSVLRMNASHASSNTRRQILWVLARVSLSAEETELALRTDYASGLKARIDGSM